MDFTAEQTKVIKEVQDWSKEGLNYTDIILGLKIQDREILEDLLTNQSKEFYKEYKNGSSIWLKFCTFIENIFGYDLSSQGINGKNSNGVSPLHMFAGSEPMVDILLAQGADPNIKNADGLTAITQAASLNKLSIVEQLHKEGADLKVTDNKGNNILANLITDHAPDVGRDLSVVFKYFVKHGVDPNQKNFEGKSALDLAKESSYKNSLPILLERSQSREISR